MSTESTTDAKEPFLAVTGDWILYDEIVSLQRINGESPDDPQGYMVTYLPKGSTEREVKWVSYYVYCALKPHEQSYRAKLEAARPKPRTYTHGSTGFEVLDPAPSLEEFLAGAPLYNQYDCSIRVVDPPVSSNEELDGIRVRCTMGYWQGGVFVEKDYGITYPVVYGTYVGAESQLFLVLR